MSRYLALGHYLREVAGLTLSRFLDEHKQPVLLWPQAEVGVQGDSFQFETFSGEFPTEESREIPPRTQSQIGKTSVIEIRKRSSPAPSNMICVGRAANNDIVFTNATVSKLHAYFVKTAPRESYEIVDANSTNGTMVGSKRLVAYHNQLLADGDLIHFGPSVQVTYLTPQGFYDLLQQLHRSGVT